MSLEARLHRIVTKRIDPRPVGVVRVVIGLATLIRLIDGVAILRRLQSPTTLRLPYVTFAPEATETVVTALVIGWAVSAGLFMVGRWTRTAGTLLAATLATVTLLDQQTYSNHLYLLTLVVGLLVLADAGRAFSLDARLARREVALAPAWPVTLLKLQVSVVYAFAALSKVNEAYLSGIMLAQVIPLQAAVDAIGIRATMAALSAAAVISIALEAAVAIGLWIPNRRHLAAALGVALHVGMIASIADPTVRLQLVVFALEMWSLYLLFFTPAELRELGRRIARRLPARLRPRVDGRAPAG